ncbi:kinase D-interacting substrate of 220 kDa-like isoform X4 [Amphibalanus amphitrite]|nr:kinase D-interacting substrate of 220 kDa-like isoform X4 [Amphibalanus amphitrite]XP_043202866.1 kinase D-interacting substrate of 220 kDa-like isoform X4 [Amphibalanus amphitrite]
MVSLSFTSLTTLINREDLSAFTSFLNNRNVAVDDRDENGTTAMMVASEKGHSAFIHALVEFGADATLSDLDNWTALHFAAKEGHVACVRELLEAGANTEAKDMGGWTPLLWAAYQHRTETVRTLLEAGANANVPGQHHMTALVWAAGRGYLDVVQVLLQHGAKVNINDKFGTSPLIWACRKGFTEIVSELLKAGANVDASGMYSWTPLLLAVKGGHTDIVDMLVAHKPNLNVTDKDGITPLIMAAKEGSYEIVSTLVSAGAYINLQDRSGDTCLICAARGGHAQIVEILLKKYADINIIGKEHKTAIYWAVEKNHYDIVKMLLEVHADTEITTKEGDTALLRAVRNRQAEMVELLLDRKARISAVDSKGDTCLHIAMRARSRHIVEILLRNPKHSKMLYRPNKAGETPYNIDIAHKRAILGDIFGARKLNTNEENENRLGYDLYSGALADFLSEPALTVPISVGLYAKWGSGKSFLLGKLTEEMRNFAQQWLEPVLELSPFFVFLLFNLALLMGVAFGTGFCNVTVGLAVGCSVSVLLIVAVFVLKFFGTKWEYEGLCAANARVARAVGYLLLLARITFCHPPGPKARRDKMRQIRFFFAERASVTSAGRGDNSIVQMISSLYEDIEQHCGLFACRLFRAFRPQPVSPESESSFRHLCLVPYAFIFLWTLYVAMATIVLTVHFFTWEPIKAMVAATVQATHNGTHSSSNVLPPVDVEGGTYETIETLLIVLSVTLGIVVLANILTIGKVFYALILPHRLYLNKLSHTGGRDKDRYVQALKDEVQLLINMVRCMDSLTDEQTRLVVVVDGLDSCEQEKVLEILDMVSTLFTVPEAPFVILLSIDPHIISKAVELNINKVFSETAISGNDYLKNLIHLPFFLQNSALRKVNLAQKVAASRERRDTWIDTDNEPNIQQHAMSAAGARRMSVESVSTGMSSKSRLRLPKKQLSRLKGTESIASSVASNLNRIGSSLVTGTSDLNRVLLTDDYFSDVNPRSMRRLMNVIYISGRLVKAFHIDFNWYHLASWINITEQWPYHTTWMILYFEFNESKLEDRMSLYELYTRIRVHIPSSREADPLSEYDRDEKKLDVFLSFHKHTLTLADMKVFLPFTINLDPFIKKVVKEEHFDPVNGQLDGPAPAPAAAPAPTPAAAAAAAAARLRTTQRVSPPPAAPPPGQPWFYHWPVAAPAPDLAQWAWPYGSMPAWSPPMPPAAPPPAPTPNIQLPSVCSDRPLSSLSVEDVCQLVSDLAGISAEAAARYHRTLRSNNISGWVLCACEMPALKRTMKMTFGDWETFRAAVETLRKREAAGPTVPCSSAADPAAATFTASAAPVTSAAPTSAASDAAEARKIRFQLTTDSGKVTQANSATSSTVTSPLVSDGRQPPPSSQSSGSVRRRSGPDNHLEKQVTLEEQMIWGALQTLNEDACEDLREDQEVMAEEEEEQGEDAAAQEEEAETAVLYLQRSPGSPPVPSGIEEVVGSSSHGLSRSGSVLSVRASSVGGAASPERRRPRTISVRSVRPSSLVGSSVDPRSPPSVPLTCTDDPDRLSLGSCHSEAAATAGSRAATPGSPRHKLNQLKEYLSRTLPQRARPTPNGEALSEVTPLVEIVRPELHRQESFDKKSESREGTPRRTTVVEMTPLVGEERSVTDLDV